MMFERKRFMPDELQEIHRAVRKVWQQIGDDICEVNGGREPGRAAKAEVIIDAGRLEQTIRALNPTLADKVSFAANLELVVRRML